MSRFKEIEFKVMVPEQILISCTARKIIAEAPDGFFCLKPGHIDFVSVLQPGILYYTTESGERYVATGEGLLVKCGNKVLVSVLSGYKGADLKSLENLVRTELTEDESYEEKAGRVLYEMEADLLRYFSKLEAI